MLADLQRDFATFLLTGADAVAARLRPDLPTARLTVYRNTVAGSLVAVLGQAYPTVRRAIGEAAFAPLAARYATRNPPRLPMLWCYGDSFAEWLESDAALPPWLPDLARLDRAMHEALFAQDAEPLDPTRLAAVPPERVGTLRLMPHPAVRLVRSSWSVHDSWKTGAEPSPAPEAVLVGRRDGEVLCARLDPADGDLAAALLAGRTLDRAAESSGESGGDLQGLLARLLLNRLIVGYAFDAAGGTGDDR